jgi:tRNA (mo5U34)-methyltransferase
LNEFTYKPPHKPPHRPPYEQVQYVAQQFPDPKVQAVLQQFLPQATQTATEGNAPRWIQAWDTLSTNTLQGLQMLKPWRKGPWQLDSVFIDTEWRSNIKWDRIQPYLPDLLDKRVADIGCGNGYYMYQMREHNPRWVLGLDPSSLFLYQFYTIQSFMPAPNLFFYPIGVEALLNKEELFDCVFFMGVLYHRPNPIETLRTVARSLAPGGYCFIETLTIEGSGDYCLSPVPRYAQMRNVFFLPTDELLQHWLLLCGFEDAQIIDVSITTTQEQRKTDWINTQSLEDFLDSNNPGKTIEGYPAPRRTLIKARRKQYRKG